MTQALGRPRGIGMTKGRWAYQWLVVPRRCRMCNRLCLSDWSRATAAPALDAAHQPSGLPEGLEAQDLEGVARRRVAGWHRVNAGLAQVRVHFVDDGPAPALRGLEGDAERHGNTAAVHDPVRRREGHVYAITRRELELRGTRPELLRQAHVSMTAREETLQLAFGHKRPLADVNRLGASDLQEEVVLVVDVAGRDRLRRRDEDESHPLRRAPQSRSVDVGDFVETLVQQRAVLGILLHVLQDHPGTAALDASNRFLQGEAGRRRIFRRRVDGHVAGMELCLIAAQAARQLHQALQSEQRMVRQVVPDVERLPVEAPRGGLFDFQQVIHGGNSFDFHWAASFSRRHWVTCSRFAGPSFSATDLMPRRNGGNTRKSVWGTPLSR